jgi:Protein of unknown function (DUF1445)
MKLREVNVPSADGRPVNPAELLPAEARALFRGGLATPTSGWSSGYAQANLIIVPKAQAFDVLLFAQRNPKSCPVLGVLDAGETSGPLLAGGDIRTDVPKYVVYQDGRKVDEPTDISNHWRDDLVTFIVGCSFTFESALQDNGIRVAHIDQGVNVPMYRRSPCAPFRPPRWPTPSASRPVIRPCTAPRSTWATPPSSASRIWAGRTSATRSGSRTGTSRSSGRVA